MLSFMSDRRVLAVSAACITAAIFLFLLGTFPSWKEAVGHGFSWPSEPADMPAPAAQPAPKPDKAAALSPAPSVPTPAAGNAAAPVSAVAPAAPTPAPVAPATMPAVRDEAVAKLSFDIVRVEPTGESVVAARAKPGADVVLLDQGRVIARAQADSNGQVAFVPPTLGPGDHSLMLSVGEPDQPGALSSQSVAVSVPERAKTAPLVALLQPDQPTKVLSGATMPAAAKAGTQAPAVSVGAIDVEEMGSVFATGRATPGSQCRVYLNGSFVAGVTTGPDGTWSLKIEHGMRPGHYNVRVDELASVAGDVKARAEVPFDYPARTAGAVSLLRPRKGQTAMQVPTPSAAAPLPAASTSSEPSVAPAKQGDAASATPAQAATATPSAGPAQAPPTVVAQLLTTRVVHGDSLWRISRKMLGHGRRYTQIYAANTSQIRDPRLIYPGQIFVMPQVGP